MGTPARPKLPSVQKGLILSCGEAPTGGRNYPTKLDYIRPKRGASDQYAEYAEKFTEVYGPTPRSIDILFVSDRIGDVLDVRPKVWGTGRLKAVGLENLAELPPDEFADAITAFDWELETYPDSRPEPGRYVVGGRDDKLVTKKHLKLYGTLIVALPKVTGLMLLCEISTTSFRTIRNWHAGISQALALTGGVLVGIPHELRLRPARTQYWDEQQQKRRASDFHEWVIESSYDLEQLRELASERRRDLAAGAHVAIGELPPVRHDDADRDAELSEALWRADEERRARRAASELPHPSESESIRDEPAAGADDALLNRIARLEGEVGRDSARVTLRGVFGVDDARSLDAEDATSYAEMLERAAATEASSIDEVLEGEVVEDSDGPESPDGESVDGEESEVAQASLLSEASEAEVQGDVLEEAASPPDVDETVEGSATPSAGDEEEAESAGTGSVSARPDGLLDPADIAGAQLVPIGKKTGSTLAEATDKWIGWALSKPERFVEHEDFYVALEFYARSRRPEVWEKVREEEPE